MQSDQLQNTTQGKARGFETLLHSGRTFSLKQNLNMETHLGFSSRSKGTENSGAGAGGLINRSTWYILVDRIRFYVKSHREDSPLVILGMLKFAAYHLDYVYSFFDN